MTYSESARGLRINWKRALQELADHSLLDEAQTFKVECWNKYQRNGTISATRVLQWLGY